MRALIVGCLVGTTFFIPICETVAQDGSEAQMTTSCLVEGTSWRGGKEFVVQAKRQVVDEWYYDNGDENVEITFSYKQIASQRVPPSGDDTDTYEYKFTSADDQELPCFAEFKRRGSGSGQIKFIKAYCRGDQPYECDKNYNENKARFRVRFTIGR